MSLKLNDFQPRNLDDCGSVAQMDEKRARILLAQGRNSEAERAAEEAVSVLEKGTERGVLAEALTTHGSALARLGYFERARETFDKAIKVAETAGAQEIAGRAALTIIEEFGSRLSPADLRSLYERADKLLGSSQNMETLTRLRLCARRLIAAPAAVPSKRADNFDASSFIHASEKSKNLLHYAQCVAASNTPLLITGETGTGKGLLARLVHKWSGRPGPFITINCAALTDELFESQLFGNPGESSEEAIGIEEGAVRSAAGGTLFFDEIGELSLGSQAKILGLIERVEIFAPGSISPEVVEARIIAATNHDLSQDVAKGSFRADLYYRLNSFQVEIPPLRERSEDIPVIARHFIEMIERRTSKRVSFTPASLEAMRLLPLKGNARELLAIIERIFIAAEDGAEAGPETVETNALRQINQTGTVTNWPGCSLEEEVLRYEKNLIRLALEAAQGRITRAAHMLGITHQGLAFILNGRHKDLLGVRLPIKRRRVSIIRLKSDERQKRRPKADQEK